MKIIKISGYPEPIWFLLMDLQNDFNNKKFYIRYTDYIEKMYIKFIKEIL